MKLEINILLILFLNFSDKVVKIAEDPLFSQHRDLKAERKKEIKVIPLENVIYGN